MIHQNKMIEKLPSIFEIRRLIESIGESNDPRLDRRVSSNTDLYQVKMALKYQFLVAGTAAEVSGIYRPRNEPFQNAYETEIFGEPAAVFILRKSRQKTKDIVIIGPCLPLKKEYEPWTREVLDYVNFHQEPFTFQTNPRSSKRTLEACSTYIFNCLNWNGSFEPEINNYKSQDTEWKRFTNSCISKARLIDLFYNYGLDEANILSFTSPLRANAEITANDVPKSLNILTRIAESYFLRLCKARY